MSDTSVGKTIYIRRPLISRWRSLMTATAVLLALAVPAVSAHAMPAPMEAPYRAVDAQIQASTIPPAARPLAHQAARKAIEKQRMWHYAMHSPAANDRMGVQSSVYRGKFYNPGSEDVRLCIVKRESEGHYKVVNSAGYMGAYQMSGALADGAAWMMLKEHKQLLGAKRARAQMAHLRATPFNQWNRYWQDAAFWTVYNWTGTGSGSQHWAGGRWHC